MNIRSPQIKIIFALCVLGGLGLNTAFAQTENRTRRADQLRQTLPPESKSPGQPVATAKMVFSLEDGTVVKLKLMRNLFSSDVQDEDSVQFEVIEDVVVDDVTVIQKGAKAEGTIIEAQAARRLGKTGRIGVRLDYVFLASGKRASLRAVSARSDGSRGMQVAENTLLAATYFFPAAPFFLLQKGKDVTIPKGTLMTAFIDGEHALDRERFSSPSAPRSSDGTGIPKP